jgi:hypothetical protein
MGFALCRRQAFREARHAAYVAIGKLDRVSPRFALFFLDRSSSRSHGFRKGELVYSLRSKPLLYSRRGVSLHPVTVCSCRRSSLERHWVFSAWLLAGAVRLRRPPFRPVASVPPIPLLSRNAMPPFLNGVFRGVPRKGIWENPP